MKKKILLLLVVLLGLSGCKTDNFGSCPVKYCELKIEKTESESFELKVCYSFKNIADKDIEKISFSFYLFSADDDVVPAGNNYFVVSPSRGISAKETVNVETSLTDYIKDDEDREISSWNITFFKIENIEYSDGSTWSDPLGLFCYDRMNSNE